MTKNYIKPELEMISVCSEGVLAVSFEATDLADVTGEDIVGIIIVNPF